MKETTPRVLGRIALLVVLLATTLLAPATFAQGPQPPSTPTALPPGTPPVAATAQASAPDAATAEATPVSGVHDLSTPTGIQGVVKVDVEVPATIRAGDLIEYTYTYTNTTTSAISGILIDATWTDFSTRVNGNVQFCEMIGCTAQPNSVRGPAVTQVTPPSDDVRQPSYRRATFKLGALAPNTVGSFKVRLRSRSDKFPRTNQAPTRPAGSVLLTLPGGSKPISEDTANTMAVGPVLVLSKTAAKDVKLYPGEETTFTITVGNATGSGDIVNGVIRADARVANAVEIVDTFPEGSEVVRAGGGGIVDAKARTITWRIGFPVRIGTSVSREVVFRKLDVNKECGRLNNTRYSATSPEYPMNGATRYAVSGPAASVFVVTPIVIPTVTAVPSSVVYGGETTLTFSVQNYWDKPLTNLLVHYDVQSNAFFVPGSAGANVLSAPKGDATGGTVTWRVTIPAGNKIKPTFTSFTLKVRGGFTSTVAPSTGQVRVTAPAGVPSACVQPRAGRANLKPRLTLTKQVGIDDATTGVIYVQRGQAFPYVLTVTNGGTTQATGVVVTDLLPTETGANFTYVPRSARVNNVAREPSTVVNGRGGKLIWNDLTIPAGGTLTIRYALAVDGRDYYIYRNTASLASGAESVAYGQRNVSVKINPQINVTKVGDVTTANPGDLVEFTLTLTNRESIPYVVGLKDKLGDFIFDHQISGYGEPQQDGATLEWPLITLEPSETVSAVYVARIPDTCRSRDYVNEVLFHNETDTVQPQPPVVAKVKVVCGALEYALTSDRATVSLIDRVVYTAQVRNGGATTATNIAVETYLPRGFRYVDMDPTSDIKTVPTRSMLSDGRTKMVWTIPSLASLVTARIKFVATSGDVVGPHEATMMVPTGGNCTGSCAVDKAGILYATRTLQVTPLITMEPKIKPITCFTPGDKLTYQLAIVNTNVHAYNATAIKVTLPFGLRFVRAVDTTSSVPAPTVTVDANGMTTVRWTNLVVPQKPSNAYAAQLTASIEVQVGQVWGTLATQVETTSPDGAIPRKDGTVDPEVQVCPTQPSVALEASSRTVKVGSTFVYQVTLANPTSEAVKVDVVDQLPANITYVSMARGTAPTVSGSKLTWTGLNVPAQSGDAPGVLILQFRATLRSGAAGTSYANSVTATSASSPIDGTFRAVSIAVP